MLGKSFQPPSQMMASKHLVILFLSLDPDPVADSNYLKWFTGFGLSVVNTDFSAKGLHFSAKCKIFPLTVKDAERALFARIQLGRSRARYPGRPRAFFGEPHVVTV